MREALQRLPLASITPVAFASTVVAVSFGSSSVPDLHRLGRDLRWVALAVLLVVSTALALRSPLRGLPGRALSAFACAFVLLALVSAAWSPYAHTTIGRWGTLAAAFGTAGALAVAVRHEPALGRRLLWAIAGAAGLIAAAGVLLAVVAPRYAIQNADITTPARLRGLGENPNTVSLLLGVASPAAGWLALTPGRRRCRLLAAAILVLLAGSIIASESRGALVASVAGLAVVAVVALRGIRLPAVLLIAVVGYVGLAFAFHRANWHYGIAKQTATPHATQTVSQFSFLDPAPTSPVDPNELGRPAPGTSQASVPRSYFGSGGRALAWQGALDQALQRPLLGYGFGTENRVFVDRVYFFEGSVPESTLIGTTLQLGLVGLALLVSMFAAAALRIAPLLRRSQMGCQPIGAFAGIIAGGIALTVVQSYATSVGNVGMLTFWTAIFVGGALAASARERPDG